MHAHINIKILYLFLFIKIFYLFFIENCCIALLITHTTDMSWSTKHIRRHIDTRHCLSLDNYKDIYVDTSDAMPGSEIDSEPWLQPREEMNVPNETAVKASSNLEELARPLFKTMSRNLQSPVRPVTVSIPRMDKSLISQHFEVKNDKFSE